jgi:archaellum component FlaC
METIFWYAVVAVALALAFLLGLIYNTRSKIDEKTSEIKESVSEKLRFLQEAKEQDHNEFNDRLNDFKIELARAEGVVEGFKTVFKEMHLDMKELTNSITDLKVYIAGLTSKNIFKDNEK